MTSEIVRIGEQEFETLETGSRDGAPVIFLHGFPDLAITWDSQMRALANAGFRCLAFNQRGYGRSSRPREIADYHLDQLARDVLKFADHFGFERFSLVGHDWGSLVSWWTASYYPERIASLSILNAPHPSIFRKTLVSHPEQLLRSWYVFFIQIPRIPEFAISAKGFSALERSLIKLTRPGAFDEKTLALYREAWAQPGAMTAMLNYYRALRLMTRPSDSVRVRAPTLILWGYNDPFISAAFAEASREVCDQSEIEWFKEAGHWVHRDQPDAVSAKLISFLNRIP